MEEELINSDILFVW